MESIRNNKFNLIGLSVLLLIVFAWCNFNTSTAKEIYQPLTSGYYKEWDEGNELFGNNNDIKCHVKIIPYNNVDLILYPEFITPKLVLEDISQNSLIIKLKKENKLDSISDNNWNEYYTLLNELIDPSDEKQYKELESLNQIFDIYENKEKNNEIELYLNRLRFITDKKAANNIKDELKLLLPYNNIEDESHIKMMGDTYINGFNVNKGIDYASNYATTYNTPRYQKFSNDCTNFASQILENGEVKQQVYNNENYGWWHL